MKKKVSDAQLMQSLYFMFTAGVSLHEAMRDFGARLSDPAVSDKLTTAAELMERNGYTFADAIEQVDLFPSYTKILRIGQETGNLSQIMREIAETQDKIDKMMKKIKSSVYYPVGLMYVSILIGFGLSFVLQNLMKSFSMPGVTTTFAFKMAAFIVDWRILIFSGYAAALSFALWLSSKNAHKMPIFKGFYNSFTIGRAFKLFALGIQSGLTIKDSFSFAAGTMSGKWGEIFASFADESQTRSMSDIVDDLEDYITADAFLVLKSSMSAGNIDYGFKMIGDKEIDNAFNKVTAASPLINAGAFVFVAIQIILVMSPIYMLIITFMDKVGTTTTI